jgi:hypothetical protein
MAGTIFGLPLSQQFYSTGEPMSGCLLYLYDAGTSNPATSYEDFGLSTGLENTHPLVADAAGRIPEFWLADGSYRVRLTDAQGNEIFDKNSVTAVGASSGSGGGSSSSSVSETAIHNTGDFKWKPVSGTETGWVRANGRTIGSSSSGATERANADTETLFLYMWTNFDNTLCPVLPSGRGANAAADWAANKTIGMLDMRDKLPWGMSGMGNTSSGSISDTAAAAVGALTKTVATANLPANSLSHSLSVATAITKSLTVTSGSVSHSLSVGTTLTNGTNVVRNAGSSFPGVDTGGNDNADGIELSQASKATVSLASGTVSGTATLASTAVDGTATLTSGAVSGTVSLGGSGTAMDVINAGRVGTWYVKL